MQIKVVNVDVTKVNNKNGKGFYNVAEVLYKNERGEPKSWKLFSFANPAVFDKLKDAQNGDTFEITTKKDDADRTVWTSATASDGTTSQGVPAAKLPSTVNIGSKSTYETPEERAVKQRLIVRQSSLKEAVAFSLAKEGDKANVDDVEALAERFAEWVYKQPDILEEDDDIPY